MTFNEFLDKWGRKLVDYERDVLERDLADAMASARVAERRYCAKIARDMKERWARERLTVAPQAAEDIARAIEADR